NPQPSTLNPQPSTLNPQPSTLNPQPSTLNPQPSTLNPQPYTSSPNAYSTHIGRTLAQTKLKPVQTTHIDLKLPTPYALRRKPQTLTRDGPGQSQPQ
ncbi:hypothetical protein T484DRAFT_1613968, partial [Baffinella frigidus]